MFREVVFLSLDKFKRIRPSTGVAVISILDQDEGLRRPRLAGFRDVLVMDFEDTYEERKLAAAGAWPDNPTDEEHQRFAQGRGERIPTLADAERIVAFLAKHRHSPESLQLLVHCHQGVSRSAAVALWTSVNFRVPLGTSFSTDHANPRLLRLMDKAYAKLAADLA